MLHVFPISFYVNFGTVKFHLILITWHFTSTVQGSKWKKCSYSDIEIMALIKILRYPLQNNEDFKPGFFSQNKNWTFHEIQYSLYVLYHLFNCANLFPKFRVIEMNSFSKTKKNFFLKNKNLAVFPHICLKASTLADNRQKKRFCYS